MPGYVATVLDDDGQPMDEGDGRLAVKGPTGCRYLDDPRQRDYVVDGWNVTGDTYRRDADGYYWYLARSDDMIVSSGYNIGAPEVENALLGHPAVAECAVIGVPCPERGQKVKAFVVLAADVAPRDELVAKLQDFAKATIAPYKYPREIEFVEALPKTATGKLRRSELEDVVANFRSDPRLSAGSAIRGSIFRSSRSSSMGVAIVNVAAIGFVSLPSKEQRNPSRRHCSPRSWGWCSGPICQNRHRSDPRRRMISPSRRYYRNGSRSARSAAMPRR